MAAAGALTLGMSDSAGAWTFGDGVSISRRESLSGNGRYVAFESDATNLVPGDTNGVRDVFVLDTQNGSVVRASVDTAGAEGNGSSSAPALSADGTKVAFQSDASNLVAGDTNGQPDVFVRNLTAGTTTQVSVNSSGGQVSGQSTFPSISADGGRIAFDSTASTLVSGDTNGKIDVFVRDVTAGTTILVSVSSSGVQADTGASASSISADGSTVAFHTNSGTLVEDDTNGLVDVFVRNLETEITVRASLDSSDAEAVGGLSSHAALNSDGTKVVFHSTATNLVQDDTNGLSDVFFRDLATSSTERVSIDSAENQATGGTSTHAAINAAGTMVAFESWASNLVAGDTNSQSDIFVRDVAGGTTLRASVDSSGAQANSGASTFASLSTDGSRVSFCSTASNLVAGDTNGVTDVFVRDLTAGTTAVPVTLSGVFIE